MEKTIHELLLEATMKLKKNNIATPRLDAEVILAHQLGWQRIDFITKPHTIIEEAQGKHFRNSIEERVAGKPVQYIVGQQEFMGLTFRVTPAVLIPRPDTEILVEAVIEEAKTMEGPLTILEIGTGSGAIALSLAHFIKDAQVHTVDISPAALVVAKENARVLSLQEKVQFHLGDLFSSLGEKLLGKVDILVSNPPYIPRADIIGLQKEVQGFEPSLALDGGVDGLDFYKKLIDQGQKYLSPQGRMMFEVGHDQGQIVGLLINQQKTFGAVQRLRDLAGIERVVLARIKQVIPLEE